MGELLSYSLGSGLLLAAMYLTYKWIMASENQHSYNRAVLWGIYIMAMAIPSLFPTVMAMLKPNQVLPYTTASVEIGMPQAQLVTVATPLWPKILLAIYLLGAILTTCYTIMVMFKLAATIASGEKRKVGRYTLVLTNDTNIAPFSWLHYIVMSRNDYGAWGEVITTHETRHLSARHWVDLLMAQLVAIFQWYNPAAWLMREELKTVHEYQADEAVIKSGANARQYQMLLIKKAVGARFPSLANSLNHSKLKKRVTMMYQKKSSASRRFRALTLIPAAAIAMLALNLPAVASALAEASTASLDVADSKVTQNNAEKQNAEQATAGKISKITDANGETIVDGNVTVHVTNDTPNHKVDVYSLADKKPTVYINGKKAESYNLLNEIPPSTIESMTVNKSGDNDALYVVLKKSDAKEAATATKKQTNSTTITINKGQDDSSQNVQRTKNDNAIFFNPEEKPQFPGGMEALIKFMSENIRYPDAAFKNGVEGRVIVKFVVTASGKVGEATVLKSISPELDAEALRVVNSMPTWTPGKLNGKPVNCHYVIPVSFKLQKDEPKASDQTK